MSEGDLFSEKIKELFCLKQKENDELNYKPANDRASAIAEKLKKAREKIAAEKGQTIGKLDILSRYVSILSVALKIDINTVKNYTVWQLFDQYERFSLHEANDLLGQNAYELWDLLSDFKDKEYVEKIGVSVYTPEQLIEIIDKFDIDIVQLPLNLLDQRFVYLMKE